MFERAPAREDTCITLADVCRYARIPGKPPTKWGNGEMNTRGGIKVPRSDIERRELRKNRISYGCERRPERERLKGPEIPATTFGDVIHDGILCGAAHTFQAAERKMSRGESYARAIRRRKQRDERRDTSFSILHTHTHVVIIIMMKAHL